MVRKILVIGATGKQGGAFIRAAVQSSDENTKDIQVIALTRKASSPSAKAISGLERVQVVEANLDKPDTVRQVFHDAAQSDGGLWGVFVVLAFPGLGADATGEEKQGKVCCDTFVDVPLNRTTP